jgi:hypothetical protein
VTGYANEENTAVNMRDNYCGTLQDKPEICRKDWDQFVADLNEVIKSGELTNQALEAGDKTGYFDMYIEHSSFCSKIRADGKNCEAKISGSIAYVVKLSTTYACHDRFIGACCNLYRARARASAERDVSDQASHFGT